MGFLTGEIKVRVYNDTAQTEFPTQLALDIDKEFSSSTAAESQGTTVSIDASASVTLNFNNVDSVKAFYIYSDTYDVNVNINSTGNVTYTAQLPGFVPAQPTSMVITNTSSSGATTVHVVLIKG